MANIKGILVEIGGDTSGLQKSLSKVNSSTASLSKELRGINTLLKLDPKNTELLSQKQTVLNEKISTTEQKLESLKSAKEQADNEMANGTKISEENYRNLQREIINTENQLKQMKAEASNWTKAGTSLTEYGTKIDSIGSKAGKLGTTLTTTVTAGVTAVSAIAIKTFNEVDEGADTVIKKTGATGDAAKELENVYKNVSGKVSGEFKDIGNAVGEINTRFGFTGDVLDEASQKFLQFAKINDTDVNTAVQKVSRYMGDASIESSKYGDILDQLSSVAQASGISIDTLTEYLTKYGAPMRALGLDTKESIAIFAGWEKAGVNTEIAFSGMKKAIGTWGKEGKNSTEEFKKTLEEIKKCPDVASATTKAIEVFGQKAGPDLADAIQGGRFEYTDFLNILEGSQGIVQTTYEGITDETDIAKNKMKELKVEFSEVGASILNEAAPAVEDIMNGVKDLISKFNKLDPELKKNILKYTALAAAAGPVIKIGGSVISVMGKTITSAGSLCTAIGKVSNGVPTANNAVGLFAKGLVSLSNPLTAATALAIAGSVAAYAYDQAVMQNANTAKNLRLETEKQIASKEELAKKQSEQLTNNLVEINNTEELWNELKKITDENGNVKQGYEDRASYITGELSSALGIEIDLNNGVIDKYKEIQGEIDKLILKKKAEVYMQSQEEAYNTAISKRAKAYESLVDMQNKLSEAQQKANYNGNDFFKSQEAAAAKIEIQQLTTAMKNQNDVINGYTEDVQNYEENMKLMAQGTSESLNQVIDNSASKMSEQTLKLDGTLKEQISSLQTNVNEQKKLLDLAKANHDDTNAKVYENQIKADEQQLIELGLKLAKMTSSVNELSPEQIDSWKNLANSSYIAYSESLKSVPENTKKKIQEATGIIISDTSVSSSIGNLANNGSMLFDKNLNISQEASNEINKASNNINADTSVNSAAINLAGEANKGFNNNVDGNTWGTDLSNEISSGMTSQKSKSWIESAGETVAGWISNFLHFSLPEEGPLSDMDESMPDMIDLMVKGIYDNKYKLTKSLEELSKEMNGNLRGFSPNISQKVIDSTKTIYTTPKIVFNVQELDNAKLEQCFNYVNRKFGTKY